jgi:hypothetical protein
MTGSWVVRTVLGTVVVTVLAWSSHAWLAVFVAYAVGILAAAGYRLLRVKISGA